MEVLQAVLNYESPNYWVVRSANEYNNSYLLFEISKHSPEGLNVIQDCEFDGEVILLERIQNPFQLGLFKIQEQKRISEGESSVKNIGYHVVHPNDKDRALKFPLDYRRYTHKRTNIQQKSGYEKHPKLYQDFRSAYDAGRNELSYEGKIIIIVCDYFFNIQNQGDYLPNYVITLTT